MEDHQEDERRRNEKIDTDIQGGRLGVRQQPVQGRIVRKEVRQRQFKQQPHDQVPNPTSNVRTVTQPAGGWLCSPSGESNGTTTDDDAINTPFEPHELREALRQCNKNRSSGDDRLTYVRATNGSPIEEPRNHPQVLQQYLAARTTTTRLEESDRRTSSEAEQVRLRDRILPSDSTYVSALQADGATHRKLTSMVDERQRFVQQVPIRIQKKTKLSVSHHAPCRRSPQSHQKQAVRAVRHDRPRESVRPRLAPRSTIQDEAARPPRQGAQVRRELPE